MTRLLPSALLLVAALAACTGEVGPAGPPGPPGPARDGGLVDRGALADGAPADAMLDAMPDAIPYTMPDAMPDTMPDAMRDIAVDAMPDAVDDGIPDGIPDGMPDADPPDAAPDCPPWRPPPGLGGVVDARVDDAEARRWLDFRRARETERVEEALDPARIAARYRVEQRHLTACVSTPDLVDLGRAIFLRRFTLAEGYGNALAGTPGTDAGDRPPPNLRRLQRGHFGGPDAASCADCHWKGGLAGAGDRADNSFLYGDGEALSTHDPRNPPALWGAGWTERVAAEMTAALHAQRDAALADAAAADQPARVALTASGVGFGALTAHPDGRLDTAAVRGVDPDLVIKPFGWKGAFPTLRAFAAHSLHIHFNLQAEELVTGALVDPVGLNLGEGPDPADPDADGVTREITEGQLTALVMFLATLDAPRIEVPAEGGAADPFVPELPELVAAPEFTERWYHGAEVFAGLGCASCHVPFMPVTDPTYTTRAALTGLTTTVDLSREAARPHPPLEPADPGAPPVWLVPVFSDFRRHDMGDRLAALHPEGGAAPREWMTRRLWGLARTGPYLHDGSAATLDEAIARHDGEAAFASDAFLAMPSSDRTALRVFLYSLRRAPMIRVR